MVVLWLGLVKDGELKSEFGHDTVGGLTDGGHGEGVGRSSVMFPQLRRPFSRL